MLFGKEYRLDSGTHGKRNGRGRAGATAYSQSQRCRDREADSRIARTWQSVSELSARQGTRVASPVPGAVLCHCVLACLASRPPSSVVSSHTVWSGSGDQCLMAWCRPEGGVFEFGDHASRAHRKATKTAASWHCRYGSIILAWRKKWMFICHNVHVLPQDVRA